MIAIYFVDIKKGREDCRKFTEQRKMDRVSTESGLDANDLAKGIQPVGNDVATVASTSARAQGSE